MAPGYAAEDGAALHFIGDTPARVVTSRPAPRVPDARDRRSGRRKRWRAATWVASRPEVSPSPTIPSIRAAPEPPAAVAAGAALGVPRRPRILAIGGGGFACDPEDARSTCSR